MLAARRTQRMIDSLIDHHIICGFGRVGRQVARDLRAARAKYVVVDSRAENREVAEGVGVRFVEGDAANDAVLIQAGIERARSRSSRARTPTRRTSSSRSPRASCALTSRSSREPRSRTPRRNSNAPVRTV